MASLPRIEFSAALYHVTSRGDRREVIFEDDEDRLIFLRTLAEIVARFNWLCHAYCLITNHQHLLDGNPGWKACDTSMVSILRKRTGATRELATCSKIAP